MVNPTHLLLVDDDPSVAITLKAVLEQENCMVRTSKSPTEVNDLLGHEQFHVAVVDLRLGQANGIDVLKILRGRQPDCASIVLTGYGSLETSVAALREGAYDYLLKPTNLDQLKRTVKGARTRSDASRACRECLEEQRSNAPRPRGN